MADPNLAPNSPLVSCLMVTCNRPNLAERAVACLADQTWPNKELVIVDDGDVDYEPVLAKYRDRLVIHYHRLERNDATVLGGLRNESLDRANGEFCMQWDDDEWYHPERIAVQMQPIVQAGYDCTILDHTLMHADTEKFLEHPFRTSLAFGTPGTIVHRSCDVRYPNQRKGEDSTFLRHIKRSQKVKRLDASHSHLFIRCFHGANTWDEAHFTERLHYGLRGKLQWAWAVYVRGDLHAHPAFQLTAAEADSIEQFSAMSDRLKLFATPRSGAPSTGVEPPPPASP